MNKSLSHHFTDQKFRPILKLYEYEQYICNNISENIRDNIFIDINIRTFQKIRPLIISIMKNTNEKT
jgi:hypothetical protein